MLKYEESRANKFPTFPSKVGDFQNLLKNPDFGTIDDKIFYKSVVSATDELAPMFLA